MYEYLRKIPGIFMPDRKEPNYFSIITCPPNEHSHPIRDKNEYLSLFEKGKTDNIIGESSPLYLSDPNAAKMIHQASPHARILILLRDPVERAYSHYLMYLTRSESTIRTFHEEILNELENGIDYNKPFVTIEAGLYFEDVKRFFSTFGKNQVKIIIFEEFVENKKNTLEEILMFLGLNAKVVKLDDIIHNPYGQPKGQISKRILKSKPLFKLSERIISSSTRKHLRDKFLMEQQVKPKMDAQDRDLLIKYYKSDVKNLHELLGRKLPWHNFIHI